MAQLSRISRCHRATGGVSRSLAGGPQLGRTRPRGLGYPWPKTVGAVGVPKRRWNSMVDQGAGTKSRKMLGKCWENVKTWWIIMDNEWISLCDWWFGTYFFPYIGKNISNWLIFFREVETTNQLFTNSEESVVIKVGKYWDTKVTYGLREYNNKDHNQFYLKWMVITNHHHY